MQSKTRCSVEGIDSQIEVHIFLPSASESSQRPAWRKASPVSQYKPKPVPPVDPRVERELKEIQRLPYGLRGFRRFTRLLVLSNGEKFKLEAFQAFMLALHFAGIIELVILIPKKNGKTTLLAVLALYHLLMIHGAEVVIGAAAEKQAAIIFDQAAGFVVRSGLEGVFDVKGGYRIIRLRGQLERIRVLCAKGDTVDGVIPTLALVDELHRHPTDDLYGIFRGGLDGPGGQMITISTAGSTEESPLGRLRELAQTWPIEQVGKRKTYAAPDDSFALVEWSLDLEDDPSDMKTVKKVNPAPWHTLEKLGKRYTTSPPGQWLRYACGIWTAGDEPEILPMDWDPLRADIGGIQDGDPVVLAPSVGKVGVIGIASKRGEKVAIRAEHISPNGLSIMAHVEDAIVQLCDRYDVRTVLDPGYGMQRSMELLEARGVPVEQFPYSTPRQIAATATFDRFLRGKEIIHDGDPKTRSHVLSAFKQVGTNGEHYVASDESRAIVAIAMAVHVVTGMGEPTPRIHVFKGA
jgi:phage terminase large subunit-like protein